MFWFIAVLDIFVFLPVTETQSGRCSFRHLPIGNLRSSNIGSDIYYRGQTIQGASSANTWMFATLSLCV